MKISWNRIDSLSLTLQTSINWISLNSSISSQTKKLRVNPHICPTAWKWYPKPSPRKKIPRAPTPQSQSSNRMAGLIHTKYWIIPNSPLTQNRKAHRRSRRINTLIKIIPSSLDPDCTATLTIASSKPKTFSSSQMSMGPTTTSKNFWSGYINPSTICKPCTVSKLPYPHANKNQRWKSNTINQSKPCSPREFWTISSPILSTQIRRSTSRQKTTPNWKRSLWSLTFTITWWPPMIPPSPSRASIIQRRCKRLKKKMKNKINWTITH